MRTFINGLLKGRITRWSILAVVLALAGLSVAWNGQGQYRLGGGFIGNPTLSAGMHWSAFQAPLDSAGKTAALRVNIYSYPDMLAGALAYSGADTVSEALGQLAMVSNDTAKGTLVFYGLKQGTPPQVKQIWVWDGTIKFTSPDAYDVDGTTFIYPAEADTNGDGRPEAMDELLFTFPGHMAVTRVLP